MIRIIHSTDGMIHCLYRFADTKLPSGEIGPENHGTPWATTEIPWNRYGNTFQQIPIESDEIPLNDIKSYEHIL